MKKKALSAIFVSLLSFKVLADSAYGAFQPYVEPKAKAEHQKIVESILQASIPVETKAQIKEDEIHLKEGGVYFLLSRSLKDETLSVILKKISDYQSNNEKVMGVFAGIAPGFKTVEETAQELYRILGDVKKPPSVVINSLIFDEAEVTKAPALAKREGETIYVAYGIYGLEHFERSIELKKMSKAPIPDGVVIVDPEKSVKPIEVSEIPLKDDLKARAGKVDWKSQVDGAKKRMWGKITHYSDLPGANKDRVRLIDLTVEATQEYRHPQTGQVLIAKGTRYNPAKENRFGRAIIIFDGVSSYQEEIAYQEFLKARSDGLIPIVISSRFAERNEAQHYSRLTNRFQSRIFLLTKDIKERFEIEKLPSIVTQKGELMEVREVDVRVTK